jgi:hypothetical protein
MEKIGKAAYKLELPPQSLIHLLFHILQLKSFTADYTPIFSALPVLDDLLAVKLEPEAILERRIVKKGNVTTPQVRVKWAGLLESSST